MYELAVELGVEFRFQEEVTAIEVNNGLATALHTQLTHSKDVSIGRHTADVIIGGADYHHIETALLPAASRSYSDAYWNSRVMAPGCLLYYVGLQKKLTGVQHHSLFFDTSFDKHGEEIYTSFQWPSDPLFYVNVTSTTDPSTAPEGCENLFILIPVAAGLTNDSEELRERYFQEVLTRLENRWGQSISDAIIFKKSFSTSDFISEYHAFRGNAYGLANTLLQTAVLKPSLRSKKVSNLFYTGQLTVPGPGVPPSLISGEVVAKEITKQYI
jgi:phytoene desaturase